MTILVEGLVRVTSMYDYFYRRDEKAHRLVGDRLGKTFRLGDKVKVKVDKVDMEKKKIDFKLVEGVKANLNNPLHHE